MEILSLKGQRNPFIDLGAYKDHIECLIREVENC